MVSNKKNLTEDSNFKAFLSAFLTHDDIVRDIYPKKKFDEYYKFAIQNKLIKVEKIEPKKDLDLCNSNINFESIRYFLLYNKIGNLSKTSDQAFVSEDNLKKIITNLNKTFNYKTLSLELQKNISHNLTELYDSVFEAEEFLDKINKVQGKIKLGFSFINLLIVNYINDLIYNNKANISMDFYNDLSCIKSLENNDIDIAIVSFMPESEKIETIKIFMDDLYIIKNKNKSSHFINMMPNKNLNILEEYSKISYISGTNKMLSFVIGTNSDTVVANSIIENYKIKNLSYFDNYDTIPYNGEYEKLFIIKNKNKILNEQEKNFIKILSEKLISHNVRE